MRAMDDRNEPMSCDCSAVMKRTPETFKANTFEAYYDEGLGSDIYTEKHRQSIMKAQGVIEAGDPVHGGRNFDSKAPILMKKQKVKGKVWAPPPERSAAVVSTVSKSGETIATHTVDSLPTAGKK